MATMLGAAGAFLMAAALSSVAGTLAAYAGAARARRPVGCTLEEGEPPPWWVRAWEVARECGVTFLCLLPVPFGARRRTAGGAAVPVLLAHGVVPPGNAYYPGAFNIQLRGLGHLSLLVSARVYDLVRENLAAVVEAVPPARR